MDEKDLCRIAEERLFKELEEAEKCEKFYTLEELDRVLDLFEEESKNHA